MNIFDMSSTNRRAQQVNGTSLRVIVWKRKLPRQAAGAAPVANN